MHKSLIAIVSIASATLGLSARAADNGIYLGGSIGQSGVHADVQGASYDAGATAYKLIAGWRILDWLAVEGDYVDFGSGSDKIGGEKVKVFVMGNRAGAGSGGVCARLATARLFREQGRPEAEALIAHLVGERRDQQRAEPGWAQPAHRQKLDKRPVHFNPAHRYNA